MGDELDPFDDIEKLRLSDATLAAMGVSADRDGSNAPPGVAAKLTAHRTKGGGRKRVSGEDRFIQIPVKTLIAASKLLHGKQWLVLLAIHDRVGKDDSNTIELGNKTLKEWGVSHDAKIKTLRILERSEDYIVQWREKSSPRITVREELTILPGRRRRSSG
jgi:hypothetical protein